MFGRICTPISGVCVWGGGGGGGGRGGRGETHCESNIHAFQKTIIYNNTIYHQHYQYTTELTSH